MGAWKLNLSYRLMILCIMQTFFTPFLPMFSTFDGKMVNVVENADCFWSTFLLFGVQWVTAAVHRGDSPRGD